MSLDRVKKDLEEQRLANDKSYNHQKESIQKSVTEKQEKLKKLTKILENDTKNQEEKMKQLQKEQDLEIENKKKDEHRNREQNSEIIEINHLGESVRGSVQSDLKSDFKMNPVVSNGNKLKWKFENVNESIDDGMNSDAFTIQGIDWKIHLRIKTDDPIKYLSAYLYYDGDKRLEKNWISETRNILKLLNQNENGKDEKRENVYIYNDFCSCWGYHRFLEWSKLEAGGYMKDNSVIVEIELDFKYYDFSKIIPEYADIILNAQAAEFFTNKEALVKRSANYIKRIYNEKDAKIEDVQSETSGLTIPTLFSVEISEENAKLQESTELESQNVATEQIIEKKELDVSSESEKQLKCQSCTNMDFEENLYICQTCNDQNLRKFKNEEEVLSIAICSHCAIKKHIQQKHVIVDFLPHYRAYKFENYSGDIGTMLAKLQLTEMFWKIKEQTWKTMDETAQTKIKELISLARRSKSTQHLKQNMDDINCFIETAINVNESFIEGTKTREVLMQENLQKMEKWIEEKSKECVKDEEIIKLEI